MADMWQIQTEGKQVQMGKIIRLCLFFIKEEIYII